MSQVELIKDSNPLNKEISVLAKRTHSDLGFNLSKAASLLLLTTALLNQAGLSTASYESLVQLQTEFAQDWLKARGVDPELLNEAVFKLNQASQTVAYLESLPD